jgi:hypothetical protein
MTDDEFKAWLARQDKEASYATESHKYGNPANHVKFLREKGEYMDRIKGLLREWACYYQDGLGSGYPKQSPFATERVDGDNRSTETYRAIPDVIVELNDHIERGLAPAFKIIIKMEYRDRRPQKTKALVLDMTREVFNQRLKFAHEQLMHMMRL